MDSLVIALISLVGGAVIGVIAERSRRAHDLRQRGAAILGPIFTTLHEADPDRMAINAGPHSQGQIKDLWERSAKHDADLQTLAIELPPSARAHARELATALHNSLNRTSWLVRDVLQPSPRDFEQARADAVEHHAAARRLADLLGEDLQPVSIARRRRR